LINRRLDYITIHIEIETHSPPPTQHTFVTTPTPESHIQFSWRSLCRTNIEEISIPMQNNCRIIPLRQSISTFRLCEMKEKHIAQISKEFLLVQTSERPFWMDCWHLIIRWTEEQSKQWCKLVPKRGSNYEFRRFKRLVKWWLMNDYESKRDKRYQDCSKAANSVL